MTKQKFKLDDPRLEMKDTATLVPKHPKLGKLEGISLTFYATTSSQYLNAYRKKHVERMKTLKDVEDREFTVEDIELKETERMEILAECLHSWEGVGKEANKKNAMEVFKDPKYKWLYVQAISFQEDSSNYFLD